MVKRQERINWFRRNALRLAVVCGIIAVTLGVISVLYGTEVLFMVSVAVSIVGAAAFATYVNKCIDGPKMRCRACGSDGAMALEYEDGGVCRECLLYIVHLPGVLKEKGP